MRGVLRTWREWFEVSATFAEASKALQLAGSVLLPDTTLWHSVTIECDPLLKHANVNVPVSSDISILKQ